MFKDTKYDSRLDRDDELLDAIASEHFKVYGDVKGEDIVEEKSQDAGKPPTQTPQRINIIFRLHRRASLHMIQDFND